MFCTRHSFFCSQVFKTTSNVLNSDVNIVNIALILLAGGDKVGSMEMSSLLSCGSLADSLLQLSFVLALL